MFMRKLKLFVTYEILRSMKSLLSLTLPSNIFSFVLHVMDLVLVILKNNVKWCYIIVMIVKADCKFRKFICHAHLNFFNNFIFLFILDKEVKILAMM